MKSKLFDIFIPVAPKDLIKLPFVIDGIIKHVNNFNKIHVVYDNSIESFSYIPDIIYHSEKDVLDFDKTKIKHRPGWQYQQYLKLFQRVTECPLYMTLDCDIVILRNLNMWNIDKPVWYIGHNQYHIPYFIFQEKMIGFGKQVNFSWIADMNFFDRNIIDEMIYRFGYTKDTFLQKAIEITCNNCYMGEPEFYGSYVAKYHPNLYDIHVLKRIDGGSNIQSKKTDVIFSSEGIQKLIDKYSNGEHDIMSIHSWFDEI